MSEASELAAPHPRLSGRRREVLTVLAAGPLRGQAVIERVQASYDDDIKRALIYQRLRALEEDKGLVRSKDVDGTNAKEYELTDDGRAWLRQQHEWERQYVQEVVDDV